MMAESLTPAPAQRKTRRITLEDYFRAEEKSLTKHEYHNRLRIPIAGGTFNHDNLAHKAAKLIDNFIEDNDYPYFVNGSDTKIRIESVNRVVYPDAVVICEQPIFYQDRQDTIINPLIVVEVLSKSTENFDRNTKFECYRTSQFSGVCANQPGTKVCLGANPPA